MLDGRRGGRRGGGRTRARRGGSAGRCAAERHQSTDHPFIQFVPPRARRRRRRTRRARRRRGRPNRRSVTRKLSVRFHPGSLARDRAILEIACRGNLTRTMEKEHDIAVPAAAQRPPPTSRHPRRDSPRSNPSLARSPRRFPASRRSTRPSPSRPSRFPSILLSGNIFPAKDPHRLSNGLLHVGVRVSRRA